MKILLDLVQLTIMKNQIYLVKDQLKNFNIPFLPKIKAEGQSKLILLSSRYYLSTS